MEDFFGGLIAIGIAIFVALWLIQTHPGFVAIVVLLVIGFFVVRFVIKQTKEENARRAREAAQKLEDERRRAAEQREYEGQIIAACNESIVAFENIPKDLLSAEELLTVAESEFKEGVFSPFWDSVEKATYKLGAIDSNIKLIADRSQRYESLSKVYVGNVPPFPVGPKSAYRLGRANETAERLQKVVRNAQRNFHFATIYEQRKTNNILMDGFSSLGEAIYGVGERLHESIGALGHQIDGLSSSMEEHNERLVEAIEAHQEKLSEALEGVSTAVRGTTLQVGEVSSAIKAVDKRAQAATTDYAARQERANRMLDNIQRHRVPSRFAEY